MSPADSWAEVLQGHANLRHPSIFLYSCGDLDIRRPVVRGTYLWVCSYAAFLQNGSGRLDRQMEDIGRRTRSAVAGVDQDFQQLLADGNAVVIGDKIPLGCLVSELARRDAVEREIEIVIIRANPSQDILGWRLAIARRFRRRSLHIDRREVAGDVSDGRWPVREVAVDHDGLVGSAGCEVRQLHRVCGRLAGIHFHSDGEIHPAVVARRQRLGRCPQGNRPRGVRLDDAHERMARLSLPAHRQVFEAHSGGDRLRSEILDRQEHINVEN